MRGASRFRGEANQSGFWGPSQELERGRTDGVNAERRRIRERWASPRGVRFFPDAVNKPIGVNPSGGCKERERNRGTS